MEKDVNIVNFGFHKYADKYLETILSFNSGNLAIVLSTSLFNEHPNIISNIRDENNLKAIISLPVYNNEDNLLILMFNFDKTSNQFIYIDESDSLIHKEVKNWKYINEELISQIANSYMDFVENEFSVILDVSDIIEKKRDFYLFKPQIHLPKTTQMPKFNLDGINRSLYQNHFTSYICRKRHKSK